MKDVCITTKSGIRVTEKLCLAIDKSKKYRVTGIFHKLKECREMLASDPPHILLLGQAFDYGNAAEFFAEIRRQYPGIKILMLTNDTECSVIRFARDNGASGFIREDALPEELIAGLDAVMNGNEYLGGKIGTWESPPEASPEWFIPLEKEINKLMDEAHSYEEAIEKLSFIARYINKGRPLLITNVFSDGPQDVDDEATGEYLRILIENLLVEGYSNWEIADKLNISMDTARIYRLDLIQKLGAKSSMMFAKRHENEFVKFTPRDIQLLRLIAAGFTSREIADKLFLSTEAIHSRRQDLMSKSGARNTMALIMDSLRQGLIKMEDIDFLLQND
jgi:DNA-binding NarL/FixJ family response regulator